MRRSLRGGLVLVLMTASLSVQAKEPVLEIPYDGTQAFRGALHKLGMTPASHFNELITDPKRSIVIVLGDASALPESGDIEKVVRGGGAVLVATDQVFTGPFEIGVRGAKVWAPAGIYKEMPECPFVLPTRGHPLFRGGVMPDGRPSSLERVATNRPSFLDLKDTLPLLAPVFGRAVAADLNTVDGLRPFAATRLPGQGRYLVLADHSVFINAMMIAPDLDNFEFAFNCVEWLATGEPRRDRVLFVEDGQVQTEFDIPLAQKPLPLPPLDALVPPVNKLLLAVQNDPNNPDVFNRFVLTRLAPRDPEMSEQERLAIGHHRWLLGLMVVAVLGLSMVGYWFVSRHRHRPEAGLPSLHQSLTKHAPDQSLTRQRHRALLNTDNLWEAARMMVRQELPELVAEQSPRVVAGAKADQVAVKRLWRIASAAPVRVSAHDFARLPAEIERLRRALTDGSVRLDPPSRDGTEA